MRLSWLLAIFLPFSAWALNGAAEIGIGAKSKGMGGVGIALPQDAFSPAANPATLSWLGCSVDVGLGYTFQAGEVRLFDVDTDVTDRQLCNQSEGLWFPDVAVTWRFGCNQSIGFAAFVRGALSTKYDAILFEQEFNTNPSQFDAYTVYLMPSWSFCASPCLSFGIALNGVLQFLKDNVQYETEGRSLFPNRPGGYFVGPDTLDVAGGLSVRIGVLLSLCDRLNLGLTYQTPALMSKLSSYSGQWPRGGYWDWPADLGVGIAYTLCPGLLVAIDWSYIFWNETATLGNRFSGQSGSGRGPGFGWLDRTVWRLGFAWTPCYLPCGTLRIGYNYGTSPVLGDDVYLNQLTLATIAHHITVGGSYRFGCGEFSIYYYHGFLGRVRGVGPLPFSSSSSERANLSNENNGVGLSYGVDW